MCHSGHNSPTRTGTQPAPSCGIVLGCRVVGKLHIPEWIQTPQSTPRHLHHESQYCLILLKGSSGKSSKPWRSKYLLRRCLGWVWRVQLHSEEVLGSLRKVAGAFPYISQTTRCHEQVLETSTDERSKIWKPLCTSLIPNGWGC